MIGNEGACNSECGGKEIAYIGETSRPWRERVHEHLQNLKNGSTKSFVLSHWMESHSSSLEPPKFKWEVIESFGDALRRQLGEGLLILQSGVLNKRVEFNNNLICRMSATTVGGVVTEKELQDEIEKKRDYTCRLKKFIKHMSKISPVLNVDGKMSITY